MKQSLDEERNCVKCPIDETNCYPTYMQFEDAELTLRYSDFVALLFAKTFQNQR